MLLRHLFIFIISLFVTTFLYAQPCTVLGQKPSTAFPVCGVLQFNQADVPICDNKPITVPGCPQNIYSDKNPYWYKFTCYQAGTLGFTITPVDLGDDYDWQLFDITGHNPDDVYTDVSLFVVGNWSGSSGKTGASATGTGTVQCASDPSSGVPTFSAMPNLAEGHIYLLMVSHYTDSQIGYALSFEGGTASITDPAEPGMQTAEASCDGSKVTLKLNKKMQCKTLRGDGSDFTISGTTAKVISAAGIGCSAGFEVDSVILTLDIPLEAGNYQLVMQIGTDGNTLSDNCDRHIPAGSSIDFPVFLRQPTPLDSLAPVSCAPDVIQVVFKKNIRCSSIDADGSNFSITGTYPVNVVGATGVCQDGLTKIINVRTASPLFTKGDFALRLITGNDGNTIIDECGEETPAGAALNFSVEDTVSAAFSYSILDGCRQDTVLYFHNGRNSVTSWNWLFDNTQTTQDQKPSAVYVTAGNKTAQLIVSNGFCSDTSVVNFILNYDTLNAAFTGPAVYCPNELAIFNDASIGTVVTWYWEFGNGFTGTMQSPPPQAYYIISREKLFPVRLIVQNNKNCFDTAVNYLKAVNNCFIAVPSAFTPNHDGKNDYLYPLNAYKATGLQFSVFNRLGQRVFETKDWTRKWDGTVSGLEQPSGVYVWMLEYTDETGKKIFLKGSTVLIR